jgi:hypothetical protein
MRHTTLPLTRSLSSPRFLKPNTFPTPPFGLLTIRELDPFVGHQSCRSKQSYAPTQFTSCIQVIAQSGPPLGAQFGTLSMIT